MGKIVIIDGHPDPDPARFVHALAEAYAASARDAGHEVRIIGVAAAGIDVLRSSKNWEQSGVTPEVKEAQETIAWAEHIAILFPLWLGAMPGLLKGFFEQVFRPGFAVGSGKRTLSGGLLKGKSARVVVTMGMPGFFYRLFFFSHSVRSLRRNILYFAGVKPVRETLIGPVENPATRESGLKAMRKLGKNAA
ncbi:MAG TPA: NAD(P)H-dependent oxidoreductase [Xanthobacteraceae bacterium]|nr:NAD(P)H-dependent oxidoreductase [Xanthobacteraceae bacterium]